MSSDATANCGALAEQVAVNDFPFQAIACEQGGE